MAFILETILTGWIEPFLWLSSMSAIHIKKKGNRRYGIVLLYYMLIIIKQFISNGLENNLGQILMMILIEVFVVIATQYLFEGCFREKIISIIVFYCILSATELIVIECFITVMHMDLNAIFQNKIINFSCGLLIKIIQIILCYCFFISTKVKQFFYHNKERIALAVMIVVILFCIWTRNFINEKQSDTIFMLDIVWLLFLWNMFGFLVSLKQKDNYILDLKRDVNRSIERSELAQDIDRFKSSYLVNMLVMKNLLYNQQYDGLEEYMQEAFVDVEKAVLLYNHSNLAIRILISRFIQTSKEMRIPFTVRILAKEFGMDDEDICSILQNLLTNGLEAAAKVPCNLAFVSLQVLLREDGYEIICSNTCKGKTDFAKTSKQDKENHGFGVGIVDKIAKKYSAIVTRECLETKCEGIGRVKISIHMFTSESGENQL